MNAAELTKALAGRWGGKSGTARCPAHDDRSPSLAIADGDNGAPVLRCHAGCSQSAVIDALRCRGLWPEREAHRNPPPRPAKQPAPVAASDAPPPDFAALLGSPPSDTWDYQNAQGRLLGYVARIDKPGGKVVLPITWDGRAWARRALPEPRPLYGLPALAERPDAEVLVVEGEKVAVAANTLIEDHVAVTWPGGCGAVAKVDWSPLKGRHVVVWPDADEPGIKAARDVAHACMAAGAAQVRVVDLPESLPKGWDLADDIPPGLDVAKMIADARDGNAERLKALGLVSAADLVEREFKPPKWAVPDLVPEGLSILAGRPKTGKSWMALDFALAVAGGGDALGNTPCEAGDVLALLLEDTDRRLHGRIKAVLQGVPAPANLDIATTWKRADDGGLDDLRAWLASHPNARLVIIDTLQKIRGARGRDAGVYEDDYRAVASFKQLADEFTVPIVLIHHVRKEGASDPLDAVSGTAGLTGSADTIIVLKREPNDPHGLLYVRGRDVNEAEVALQFDNETGKWLRLGPGADFRKSEERRAIIRALCDGGAMTPREVAEAIGKKAGAVRVTLHRMIKAGDVSRHVDGKYAAP